MAKEKFEFYLPTDIDLDTINIPCTLQTCPISTSYTHYLPSLPANAVLLSLFSILFLSNIYLGIKHRKPFLTLPISLALALEIASYASRIQLHFNPFLRPIYLLNMISVTSAPFLITATAYLYLYSSPLSPTQTTPSHNLLRRSRTIILFLIWDIHSLGLQLAGSVIASLSPDPHTVRTATAILLAGLATQVLSLVVFMLLCMFSFLRKDAHNPKRVSLLALALLALLTRAVFRTVEFSARGGWDGKLAGEEAGFLVGDAVMVFLAGLVVTVLFGNVIGLGARRVQKEGEGKEVDDGED